MSDETSPWDECGDDSGIDLDDWIEDQAVTLGIDDDGWLTGRPAVSSTPERKPR
jgi:hypothetical protein